MEEFRPITIATRGRPTIANCCAKGWCRKRKRTMRWRVTQSRRTAMIRLLNPLF
jgi:hypothetical protein